MVEKETVDIATGEVRSARWYLLTSLSSRQCGPQELLRLFRNHWSIENRQHHVKDRSWDEDVHTLRRPGLGEVFATLVNTGLNALRLEGWFPPRMSLPWDVAALGCRCPGMSLPLRAKTCASSAQRRPSTASTVEPPDFAIVLIGQYRGGPVTRSSRARWTRPYGSRSRARPNQAAERQRPSPSLKSLQGLPGHGRDQADSRDALNKAGLACIGFVGTAEGRELASGCCGPAPGSLRFAPCVSPLAGSLESGAGHRAGWGLRLPHYPDS